MVAISKSRSCAINRSGLSGLGPDNIVSIPVALGKGALTLEISGSIHRRNAVERRAKSCNCAHQSATFDHVIAMPDLIPEGCISLCAAYDRFASELWPGHSPVIELLEGTCGDIPPQVVSRSHASLAAVINSMLEEFRHAFASGSLNAMVRPPSASENFAIPTETWDSTSFPDQAFLCEHILFPEKGYWSGLVGRTPFVKRSEFDPWLSARIDRKRNFEATPSPAVQALRTHLIGLAKDGLLPSDEVEKLALKWGLAPLERRVRRNEVTIR